MVSEKEKKQIIKIMKKAERVYKTLHSLPFVVGVFLTPEGQNRRALELKASLKNPSDRGLFLGHMGKAAAAIDRLVGSRVSSLFVAAEMRTSKNNKVEKHVLMVCHSKGKNNVALSGKEIIYSMNLDGDDFGVAHRFKRYERIQKSSEFQKEMRTLVNVFWKNYHGFSSQIGIMEKIFLLFHGEYLENGGSDTSPFTLAPKNEKLSTADIKNAFFYALEQSLQKENDNIEYEIW